MNSGNSHAKADNLYVGIMSGTSLDGVDAVLADFATHPPRLIATHYLPFPQGLSERLLSLQSIRENELHDSALLGNELALMYHRSVEALLDTSGIKAKSIRAIGCHGQTIRHNPAQGYSLQIGNSALLAELSNIDVVADFRNRDIAAGGQGAPLVPAFHDACFRSPKAHRIILNIGGVANLTDLKPGSITSGFDTGPGNMLLDAWIYRHQGRAYDVDGNWAIGGQVLPQILDALLAHAYFLSPPPKSCGREQFHLDWVLSHLIGNESAEDVQATLLELTAISVSLAIQNWGGQPDELAVCGGGAHNKALLKRLTAYLPRTRVFKSDELGIGADWVEALAFAWLARQTILGLTGSLPTVTGAKGARILGAIYPR